MTSEMHAWLSLEWAMMHARRLIGRLQFAYMALEMQLRTAKEMEHV